MSCTCFSVRLLTGLADWVISTSASHATGVKVSPAFWLLPSLPRALPAMSAAPVLTASMPEAVLNGCISMCPLPAFSQATAASVTIACSVAMSPRQISAGLVAALALAVLAWDLVGVLARAGVATKAPSSANDNRQVRRGDMRGTLERRERGTSAAPRC